MRICASYDVDHSGDSFVTSQFHEVKANAALIHWAIYIQHYRQQSYNFSYPSNHHELLSLLWS